MNTEHVRVVVKNQELTKDKNKKPKAANLKYQRDKDREKVRGIFRFHEVPGGILKFPFKMYKEDDVEHYTLQDGEVYSLPLGVARHLNKNCWYPVHQYQVDENGKPTARVGRKVQRCSFQSLEFVDIDDLNPAATDVVTVENTL